MIFPVDVLYIFNERKLLSSAFLPLSCVTIGFVMVNWMDESIELRVPWKWSEFITTGRAVIPSSTNLKRFSLISLASAAPYARGRIVGKTLVSSKNPTVRYVFQLFDAMLFY